MLRYVTDMNSPTLYDADISSFKNSDHFKNALCSGATNSKICLRTVLDHFLCLYIKCEVETRERSISHESG